MAAVVHRRQRLCAETRPTFSRRAPIASASGSDEVLCSAMYKSLPALDIATIAVWVFAALAALRSILIDFTLWRQRYRDRWR